MTGAFTSRTGPQSSFIPSGGAVSEDQWVEDEECGCDEDGTRFGLRFADQLRAIAEGEQARRTRRQSPPPRPRGVSRRRARRIARAES